jgi:hypothetical protein
MSNVYIKNEVEKTIYDPVSCSENIITKLVNFFNNPNTYTNYVKELSESDDVTNQKMAYEINTTMIEIKVFNTKSNPLFLASDIGILLGLSKINTLIRKFDSTEKIDGYIIKNNKVKKVNFLTNAGVTRCFFVSTTSPLAMLLKTFFCSLVNHTLENEPEITEKIVAKIQTNNSNLVDAGMIDLSNKLLKLESKYKEEQKKSYMLEELYINEQNKRIELQDQNIEVEIINSYNTMHIEQLKKEKEEQLNNIKNINETIMFNEMASSDAIELRVLKEKFMKPLYIYILHPEYFNKLLIKKKKQMKIDVVIHDDSSDDDGDVIMNNEFVNESIPHQKDSITLIESLLNDNTYKKNFENIFNKNIVFIEPDEILYFCFGFSRNISKKDKLILVNTQWVVNKKHYSNLINSLNNSCDTLFNSFIKLSLYKTSIDEITDIIREEFINL